MTAPSIRAWATATNTTDALPAFAVNLPTRVAGDLLLAFCAGDTTTTFTLTGTWTQLENVAGGSNALAIFGRIATNDANDNISVSAANNQDASIAVCSISGHGVTTVSTDVKDATAATGASGNADPPSLDGGSAQDWLAFAVAVVDLTATGSAITAAPTNYTTGAQLQKSASSTSSVALGVGSRALSATQTENPGTFTNTSGAWIAQTVLVPPIPSYSGTSSPTLGNTTSSATGVNAPPITGTIAKTLENTTSSATGTLTVSYTSWEWSVATKSSANTSSYASPFTITQGTGINGAIAVTLGVVASAASGTSTPPPITGTSAVTLAAVASSASATHNPPVLYPASVSGRKWLDQNGNVFLLKTCSSWALAENNTNAEIDSFLSSVSALGFNCVTVSLPGHRGPNGTGWNWQSNQAGDPYWTTTGSNDQWNTSLNTGWASYDHLLAKATELGMCVILSFYTGSSDGTGAPPTGNEGIGPVLEWQYTRLGSTTYLATLVTIGEAIATRFASYPNIIWHLGADKNWAYGTNLSFCVDALFHGIANIEGSSPRFRIGEPDNSAVIGESSFTRWDNSFTWFTPLSADSVYSYESDQVNTWNSIYTGLGFTAPVWDCEPPYVGNGQAYNNAPNRQKLRERPYVTWLRNGVGLNWGHEDIYGFDQGSWWGGGAGTLASALTSNEINDASYALALFDTYCKDSTWTHDTGTFLTTGLGTTTSTAASGHSDIAAIVYFPNSRTIAVDTTILSGTGNVRLRWYDPVAGTFSTISASEAQQTGRSVTYNAGTHADGYADWVLVVDLVAGNDRTGSGSPTLGNTTSSGTGVISISGTSAVTLPATTSSASGTYTPPAITGTSTRTLANTTSSASGIYTPPPITGTSAVTLANTTSNASGGLGVNGTAATTLPATTSTASGTYTPPPITGTSARTLANTTSSASGTYTPAVITGTSAVTLSATTSSASGTYTPPPITGTSTVTLANTTSSASGFLGVNGTSAVTLGNTTSSATGINAPPITGTAANTLASVTPSASGTFTAPGNSGDAASTLANTTSTASGTFTPGAITGTSAVTLALVASSASGTYTPPPITGTSAVTLPATTSTATGNSSLPGINGSAAITLAAATSSASGTYTPAAITGTSAVTLPATTSSATGFLGVNGSSAVTLPATTSTASGTYVPPPITGTSARTLVNTTSTASGTFTAPGNSGDAASILANTTSTASGTFTPPAITGTSARTLGAVASTATGFLGVNGTAATTLPATTSTASGTYTPAPITGTSASTLANTTSTATGTAFPPGNNGTSAVTLAATSSSASGTFTPAAVTGTAAVTLGVTTSTASGTFTPPPITGTAAKTLANTSSTATGVFTLPGATGTAVCTLAAATSSGTATFTPPAITGTSSRTLGAATSSASGVYTPPPITGTAAVSLGAALSSAVGRYVISGFTVAGVCRLVIRRAECSLGLASADASLVFSAAEADLVMSGD